MPRDTTLPDVLWVQGWSLPRIFKAKELKKAEDNLDAGPPIARQRVKKIGQLYLPKIIQRATEKQILMRWEDVDIKSAKLIEANAPFFFKVTDDKGKTFIIKKCGDVAIKTPEIYFWFIIDAKEALGDAIKIYELCKKYITRMDDSDMNTIWRECQSADSRHAELINQCNDAKIRLENGDFDEEHRQWIYDHYPLPIKPEHYPKNLTQEDKDRRQKMVIRYNTPEIDIEDKRLDEEGKAILLGFGLCAIVLIVSYFCS